jgi:hypothetical protein
MVHARKRCVVCYHPLLLTCILLYATRCEDPTVPSWKLKLGLQYVTIYTREAVDTPVLQYIQARRIQDTKVLCSVSLKVSTPLCLT